MTHVVEAVREQALVDPPAHLLRQKGQTGQVSVAFAANGVVHFAPFAVMNAAISRQAW